jgi:hypothetical protein
MPESVIGGMRDLVGLTTRMTGVHLPRAIEMMTVIDLILAVHQGMIGMTETMTGIGRTVTVMTIGIWIVVCRHQRVLRRRHHFHLLLQQRHRNLPHQYQHRPPAARLLQE